MSDRFQEAKEAAETSGIRAAGYCAMLHPTDPTEHCALDPDHQERGKPTHVGFRYDSHGGRVVPPPQWSDWDYR